MGVRAERSRRIERGDGGREEGGDIYRRPMERNKKSLFV